jgi:hypothetical protein
MSIDDNQLAWWSRLRHSGLLLSPVVQIEKYAQRPDDPPWFAPENIRNAYTRFNASIDRASGRPLMTQGDVLAWADHILEKFIGHDGQRLVRSHSIPESLSVAIRIGSRSETLKPDRIVMDADGTTPLLLVKADTTPHVGRGKGRTEYARFLELLRGSGHRLGLLTNGLQFRLIYAGLDFESWCEWEADRWFEDAEGSEELLGLRQLLFPTQVGDSKGNVIAAGLPGLLTAVEESRKRQADLSQVLRENVRRAVEMLLEDVSTASRTDPELFHDLINPSIVSNGEVTHSQLSDTEAHEALMQATVRVVMRMVVCLFAESRGLLPTGDLIYSQAYGMRTLYELLDETVRHEGSLLGLMSRNSSWPRLMALYRLVHGGSGHGAFTLRAYGGALFRPGAEGDEDPVARALYIFEHRVKVSDATIYRVLKKLLRGPLPVIKGRSKSFVEGPVDYTDLRTEFIGLIYEGLLDYRIKRTTEEIGPQVFLNLGRQPVLPLSRLESMLDEDPKSLKDLFAELKKESVTKTVESDDEEDETEEDSTDETKDETDEVIIEGDSSTEEVLDASYLDAVEAARRWARKAIVATKLITAQKKNENNTEYDARIEIAVDSLIERVVAPGEFYLVRAGNTRKGTGTFYTRPQLAVPTVHRTLQPLCYDKHEDGTLTPKTPEEILGLKVCDPACGSASFLVAALLYLSDSLYKSLCHHCNLDDPKFTAKVTLPFGKKRTRSKNEEYVPFLPDDPDRGDDFRDWVEARLRRHVVERCIYGIDINPLAVEFARVSLWVETLDDRLPFSFVDHKIKVGNAIVGCWIDEVEHYPIRAWERNGGDDESAKRKGERTLRIETLLNGELVGKRRTGRGIVKLELKELLESRFSKQTRLFTNNDLSIDKVLVEAKHEYETLHEASIHFPDEQEQYYRSKVQGSSGLQRLKHAMDEWCAIWFWPADATRMASAPTPLSMHKPDRTREEIVELVRQKMRFFHWELEFPDVFSDQRWGFDAMVGNPPWENAQPNPYEFFSDIDPLIRSHSRIELLKRIEELFTQSESLEIEWFDHCGAFKAFSNWVTHSSDAFGHRDGGANPIGQGGTMLLEQWKEFRAKQVNSRSANRPFRFQVGRVFTYKLFLEQSFFLLNTTGRMGMIVPSGLYTDSWSLPLRELFLEKNFWEWLFSFENKKKIFEIHGSFKFCVSIIDRVKRTSDDVMKAAFMVHDLRDWEQSHPPVLEFDKSQVKLFAPKSKSLPEIRSQRALDICKVIYENSGRIGEPWNGECASFNLEFMMNTDAKLFPVKSKWEESGYTSDVFGRWTNAQKISLPLYEGRMIGQFDSAQKGWVSGRGRSAVWRTIPFDSKSFEPQFLMDAEIFCAKDTIPHGFKIGFMDVTSSTNTRTFVACPIARMPCGNKVPTLSLRTLGSTLMMSAFVNSLVFDFVCRNRFGGTSLNWFIVEELPIPCMTDCCVDLTKRIQTLVASLSFIHRWFAPEWLALRGQCDLRNEWKSNWACNESQRLRARVELDAYSAHLYGIDTCDFDWIVRNDPGDPKGFWRVDKNLAFEERLTALSAIAFRKLNDGKWSATTAAELSDDDFFEMLGLPEITNELAATAKGLSGPLIQKRGGCHSWHPEKFAHDDPRYGWTWEHCREDAIALLGSEQAVDDYIAQAIGKPDSQANDPEDGEQPFQLVAEPAVKKKDIQARFNFDE